MKTCCRCDEEKPFEEFFANKRSKDGYSYYCRACDKKSKQKYYKAYYEKNRARIKDAQETTRWSHTERLVEYLRKHPCVSCGNDDPMVLEFDHLGDKTAAIATAIIRCWSWERILTEIDKCQVLCANCHRRKTHIERATMRAKICGHA